MLESLEAPHTGKPSMQTSQSKVLPSLTQSRTLACGVGFWWVSGLLANPLVASKGREDVRPAQKHSDSQEDTCGARHGCFSISMLVRQLTAAEAGTVRSADTLNIPELCTWTSGPYNPNLA